MFTSALPHPLLVVVAGKTRFHVSTAQYERGTKMAGITGFHVSPALQKSGGENMFLCFPRTLEMRRGNPLYYVKGKGGSALAPFSLNERTPAPRNSSAAIFVQADSS